MPMVSGQRSDPIPAIDIYIIKFPVPDIFKAFPWQSVDRDICIDYDYRDWANKNGSKGILQAALDFNLTSVRESSS